MVGWLAILAIAIQAPAESELYAYGYEEFFALEEVNRKLDPQKLDVELLEAAVFHASNEVRTKRRKSVFKYDETLAKAARFHSVYLAKINKVTHKNSRDQRYLTPYKRITAFGGSTFIGVAENLARISTADLPPDNVYFVQYGKPVDRAGKPLQQLTYNEIAHKVVQGWMDSKGHRKNLMGNYSFLGCGISGIGFNEDGVPRITFAQNFGLK